MFGGEICCCLYRDGSFDAVRDNIARTVQSGSAIPVFVLFAHGAVEPVHQINGIIHGVRMDRGFQHFLYPHHLGIGGLGLRMPLGRQTRKLAATVMNILSTLHQP